MSAIQLRPDYETKREELATLWFVGLMMVIIFICGVMLWMKVNN